MLLQLADNLWVAQRPLRYLGVEVGSRMTVIKLRDGGLLLHSTVQLDLATKNALDAIGPVRFVIAPNRFHHLSVADYVRNYPTAKIFGAPGLDRKRGDLKFDSILGDSPPLEWVGELDQSVFRAFPPLNETIFLHPKSRTVIFTDLLFNIRQSESGFARLLLKLDGAFGGVAVPRSFRLLIKMRRAQARATIDNVLSWDFDRLILAHGEIVTHGAKEIVRRAWSFL